MATEEQQTKIVNAVNELNEAIKTFIRICPDFDSAEELVKDIAIKSANLETILHWDFGIWKLGLPKNN